MQTQHIGNSNLTSSRLGLGCMRMVQSDRTTIDQLVNHLLEHGVNLYDHADIYGGGQSEVLFGQFLKDNPTARDQMIIQSKCGIRRGFYDLSKAHIVSSVDGILQRLGIDYLDMLLLHRPDALIEPDEVAEAFTQLLEQGKVKHFGVSNFNAQQMSFLQQAVQQQLVVNQLQLSPVHASLFDVGIHVNTMSEYGVVREGMTLDYCQQHNITVQAWSPFQVDLAQGSYLNNPKFATLNETLQAIGEQFSVTPEAVVLAWILRHPARIQAIVGSMNVARWEQMIAADNVALTREMWYQIYRAAGHPLP